MMWIFQWKQKLIKSERNSFSKRGSSAFRVLSKCLTLSVQTGIMYQIIKKAPVTQFWWNSEVYVCQIFTSYLHCFTFSWLALWLLSLPLCISCFNSHFWTFNQLLQYFSCLFLFSLKFFLLFQLSMLFSFHFFVIFVFLCLVTDWGLCRRPYY